MTASNKTPKDKFSKKRERLFMAMTAILPILIIVILELFLRLVSYGDSYKLFSDVPDTRFENYLTCNRDVGRKYFNRYEYNYPPNDIFLKEKPDNGFRIFVLGSSTAQGFPYTNNLMFSRILEDRLQTLYPEKKIEMVNTAITAINSYTLADYTQSILKAEPDAILIYAGHNEFYGAYGVGSNEGIGNNPTLIHLHLTLLDYRTYQLLRNTIARFVTAIRSAQDREEVKGTLMTRIVKNKDIAYKSEVYDAGIRQYKRNIEAILSMANRRDVPVIISEVVSNIRDLPPFSSPASDEFPLANEVFKQARAKENTGDYSSARTLYYKAKDLDGVRFRASEEINEAVRELAAQYNAQLVPMQKVFEENSPNGLIGNNLMTEHVHPNIEGFFLMADAFYQTITRSELIAPVFPPYHRPYSYHKRNWGYTPLDSLIAHHRVMNLMHHWPFQPLDATFTDYRLIYQPTNFLDSMAFEVVKQPGAKFYEAHQSLAKHYSQQGDHYKAYREYLAAITIVPFLANDYLGAVHSLVRINDFPTAEKLVHRMLEIEESFSGYFYKGEFELFRFNYKAALNAYAKAANYVENESQRERLLNKQLIALYHDGQKEHAQQVARELQRTNPNFQPSIPPQGRHFVYYIPSYIEDMVMAGFELYQTEDYDNALVKLKESLAIYETPIANRLVGDILFRERDPNSLKYLVRAHPYFGHDIAFLNNLTIAYIMAGMPSRAKGVVEEIEKKKPSDPRIAVLNRLINETQGE